MAVVLAAVFATAVVVVVGRTPHEGAWRLAWSDEFSGAGVDTADWNVRNDTYLPYEHSILTSAPDNVRVAEGTLSITARRQDRTVGQTRRQYTSGYLDTIGKHSWKYARFEMRARLPLSEGLWPAFWLRADRGLGEIDVMEAIGGMPGFVQQTVLQSTEGDGSKVVHPYRFPDGGQIDGWHVYGAIVAADSVTFTIDGHTVRTVTSADAPWLSATFAEPMNIRLNLQVGGSLPDYFHHPLDAATQLPATFQVDWVRVYQRS